MARKKNTPRENSGGETPPGQVGKGQPGADAGEFKEICARAKSAWVDRAAWQPIYDEAYEYFIPMRRPAKNGNKGPKVPSRLFDNTAMTAAIRFAGQLQQDLFPIGQDWFVLKAGAFAKIALQKKELEMLERELEDQSAIIRAMIQTSEFDNATHEMCLDLGVGTGIMLMLEGDSDHPMRFVTVPNDEAALEIGAYNEVIGLHWKTKMSCRGIKRAFPAGKFPRAFNDAYAQVSGPEKEIEISQTFVLADNAKEWLHRAWIAGSEEFVQKGTFRTKPFISPRYCRVPGEAYGRGPILFALPATKTLNKAQELTLKAAALGIMGIWGYRPGGAFNPDTARIAPGAFWAMGSTGGVLGAEVSRLDTPARTDLSQLVLNTQREQIQAAMHDERLPTGGATPRSASEIVERVKERKQNMVGAFSRLISETAPDLVRRAIDIGFRAGLLKSSLKVDDFLVAIQVQSPLAAAMKAGQLTPVTTYMQLIQTTGEPLPLHLKTDVALDMVADYLGVPKTLVPTEDERAATRKQMAEQQAASVVAEMAVKGNLPGQGQGQPAA